MALSAGGGGGTHRCGVDPGALPHPSYLGSEQLFDVPGRVAIALTMASLAVPLIVALFTRRMLGFLAGACVVLGIVSATGWVNSHWATQTVALFRITGPRDQWMFRERVMTSQQGGVCVTCFVYEDRSVVGFLHARYVPPGREESLYYRPDEPRQRYPSEEHSFDTTPSLLQRMGFALAIHSTQVERAKKFHVPFALAVPYWFLCLLAIPFPLAWTMRWRKRRRIARRAASGLCRVCGYDLRATPVANGALLAICPECGAAGERAAVAEDRRAQCGL